MKLTTWEFIFIVVLLQYKEMRCHGASKVVKTLEIFNICFPDFWVWTMDITYMYIWGALKNSFSPPEVNI